MVFIQTLNIFHMTIESIKDHLSFPRIVINELIFYVTNVEKHDLTYIALSNIQIKEEIFLLHQKKNCHLQPIFATKKCCLQHKSNCKQPFLVGIYTFMFQCWLLFNMKTFMWIQTKCTYTNQKIKNNNQDTIHSKIKKLISFKCNFPSLEYNFFMPTLQKH